MQKLLVSLSFVLIFFVAVVSSKKIVKFGGSEVPTLEEQPHHRQLHSLVHQVIRSRVIHLPEDRPAPEVGELIEFELFDGQLGLGDVKSIRTRSSGEVTWIGGFRVRKESTESDLLRDDGHFALNCVQKACTANLQLYSPDTQYRITPANTLLSPDGHGMYVLSEVILPPERKTGVNVTAMVLANRKKLLTGHEEGQHSLIMKDTHMEVIPAASSIATGAVSMNPTAAPTAAPTTKPDSDLIYDILVLYTPQAMNNNYGGSEAAIKSAIHLANDEANSILANSQVNMRLRIVGIEIAGDSFVEPGSDGKAFGTMLGWLSDSKDVNLGQRAATLRDAYGADSVLLVNAANAYCGLGYANTGYNQAYAFANYNAGCLWGGVWMHEIGHNMGCFHDRVSDAAVSASRPTYLGFGNCWDDASKDDCTCYSSVMVYDCMTPKNCTKCSGKNYLSNYLVTESGNPTGTATSSCGLQIENNRNKLIAFRKSKQPGGMIFSVSPAHAVASACFEVTINGWQLNPSDNVNDVIVSVTLDGYSATILSQSANSVKVLTPVVSNPTNIAGAVVVTTQSGRVSTLKNAFTFRTETTTVTETFDTKSLGIWMNNGSIPWSFTSDGSGSSTYLYKDGGKASNEQTAKTELLWFPQPLSTQGNCQYLSNSIQFVYWAYSSYSFCYKDISLSVYSSSTQAWSKVWTGQYGSNSGATPWLSMSMSFPANTIGVKLSADTSLNAYCRWWAPLKVDNLTMSITAMCDNYACGVSYRPSATPTIAPTAIPTVTPTIVPTAIPTATPTIRPTADPTWMPTRKPSETPTVKPTAIPTATPTLKPSAVPTIIPTAIPTATPSIKPTAIPTTTPSIKPSPVPTWMPTQKPSAVPTIRPTRVPTATPTTRTPTASPTTAPVITSVEPRFAIGSSCSTVTIKGTPLVVNGDSIASVLLDGKVARIVSQTTTSVVVVTPIIPNPTGIAGAVTIQTVGGRMVSFANAFTFFAPTWSFLDTFQSKALPTPIWRNNGTIPWSFVADGNDWHLYKDGGKGSSENFYTELLWMSPTGQESNLGGGCQHTATQLAFQYWAYSSYSFCYRTFAVATQSRSTGVGSGGTWRTVWNGKTGSNKGLTPWLSALISLPSDTAAVRIRVDTALNTNCRWWAPVKMDNMTMSFTSTCNHVNNFCTDSSDYSYATPSPLPAASTLTTTSTTSSSSSSSLTI